MSNTFCQIYLHTVFSTKDRKPVLDAERREDLFRYIWGIHNNIRCKLHRIGGVEDHVHMLASLPTTISIADYMQDVKANSSKWLREEGVFAGFDSTPRLRALLKDSHPPAPRGQVQSGGQSVVAGPDQDCVKTLGQADSLPLIPARGPRNRHAVYLQMHLILSSMIPSGRRRARASGRDL